MVFKHKILALNFFDIIEMISPRLGGKSRSKWPRRVLDVLKDERLETDHQLTYIFA